MFNGTKQNVVASSDYECLIWGMKETGPRGGEGGECHIGEGTQLKGIKGGGGKAWSVGARAFGCSEPLGPLAEKAGSWQAPCCRFGEDMVLTSQVWKH